VAVESVYVGLLLAAGVVITVLAAYVVYRCARGSSVPAD
jgi:hypothetical protein